MKTAHFDFHLPEDRIALRPAVPRDSAKLLTVEEDALRDRTVRDLPDELRAGDLLVLNETKVFPAALRAVRPARARGGGGDVALDINLLEAVDAASWRAFARPAKRLRSGDRIDVSGLGAEVVAKGKAGEVTLRFDRTGEALHAAFAEVGLPPLPPYIARKRGADARDVADYQTVYARERGSVAAPTAGLHFTPELLAAVGARGVEIARLTLHVGAGTFLPVKTEEVGGHHMHREWYTLPAETADAVNRAKLAGGRVVAVGTTTLRALEAAAARYPDGQTRLEAQTEETDIFITPGYDFQVVDGLMTNFHLPRSTLFMLVCALAGRERMLAAYAHAVREGYRFYSYGDGSLLWRG